MLLRPASARPSPPQLQVTGLFPRAKFLQPLTRFTSTGAAPLGELEMLLPHRKTLAETPETSRSCLRTPLGRSDPPGSKAQSPGACSGFVAVTGSTGSFWHCGGTSLPGRLSQNVQIWCTSQHH